MPARVRSARTCGRNRTGMRNSRGMRRGGTTRALTHEGVPRRGERASATPDHRPSASPWRAHAFGTFGPVRPTHRTCERPDPAPTLTSDATGVMASDRSCGTVASARRIGRMKKILVAYDGHKAGRRALEMAARLAHAFGARGARGG